MHNCCGIINKVIHFIGPGCTPETTLKKASITIIFPVNLMKIFRIVSFYRKHVSSCL